MQEVLDLPDLDFAVAQNEDRDLVFMKGLLRDHDISPPPPRNSTDIMDSISLAKVQKNVLYCQRKETAAKPQWQVVAPKPLRSQIFKACHHHAMAVHQGVVRTAALIKRCF